MINTHLKVFDTEANYEAGKLNLDMPNVSYCEDTEKLKYVNEIADLYDIYGTLRSSTGKISINNTDYSFSATGDDNSFGLMYSQPVSSLFIYQKEKFVSFEKIYIDTSLMKDFSDLFSGCNYLLSVDLSHFNTSSATTFDSMFSNCSNLETLDLSSFETSRVTGMKNMFKYCGKITSINLSNFDTSKVTNMTAMFYENTGLTSLNISNWNTSAVTNSSQMFYRCNALTTVTMNNTNTTTFDMIKAQLVTDSVASHVTIIRDGVSYKYQNGAWVAQ